MVARPFVSYWILSPRVFSDGRNPFVGVWETKKLRQHPRQSSVHVVQSRKLKRKKKCRNRLRPIGPSVIVVGLWFVLWWWAKRDFLCEKIRLLGFIKCVSSRKLIDRVSMMSMVWLSTCAYWSDTCVSIRNVCSSGSSRCIVYVCTNTRGTLWNVYRGTWHGFRGPR